jgi:hypothetical protein
MPQEGSQKRKIEMHLQTKTQRAVILPLLLVYLLLFSGYRGAARADDDSDYVPGQVVVQLEDDESRSTRRMAR